MRHCYLLNHSDSHFNDGRFTSTGNGIMPEMLTGQDALYLAYKQGFVFRTMRSGVRESQEEVRPGKKRRGWEIRQVCHSWTETKSHLVLSDARQSFSVFSGK